MEQNKSQIPETPGANEVLKHQLEKSRNNAKRLRKKLKMLKSLTQEREAQLVELKKALIFAETERESLKHLSKAQKIVNRKIFEHYLTLLNATESRLGKERGDHSNTSTSPLPSSPDSRDAIPSFCGCNCSRRLSKLQEVIAKMTLENDQLRALLLTNEMRAREFLTDLEYVRMRVEATDTYLKNLKALVPSPRKGVRRSTPPLATPNHMEVSINPSPERPRGVDSAGSPQIIVVPRMVNTSAVLQGAEEEQEVGDASSPIAGEESQTQVIERSSDFASLQDDVDVGDMASSSLNSLTLDEPKTDQRRRTSQAVLEAMKFVDHCSRELTSLFTSVGIELQKFLSTFQAPKPSGGDDSLRAPQVLRLIRRCLETLGPLAARNPKNQAVSKVIQYLNKTEGILRNELSAKAVPSGATKISPVANEDRRSQVTNNRRASA